MMNPESPAGFPSEKLLLVEELGHDLAAAPELVPVHDWQKKELARRKSRPLRNPAAGLAGEVERDLAPAVQWYESRRPGRGAEFRDYVAAGLKAVCQTPNINPIVHLNYRRALLRPFPFAAFYECEGTEVIVYGVLPISADPEKWHPRDPSASGNRLHQAVLILATLLGSWLGMQIVHEFGHVLGGWLTGGRVARVVLHPLTFSRTDWAINPHPLLVAWAGPVFGVLLPLAGWLLVRGRRGAYLARFFAGFCCIANGAYIAGGSFDRIGDAGDLLRYGSPIWLLWLFGLATIPLGLWLWHRQGPFFGLGAARGKVSVRAAYGTLVVVVMITIVEILFSFTD
jgi:hypothetical protein